MKFMDSTNLVVDRSRFTNKWKEF